MLLVCGGRLFLFYESIQLSRPYKSILIIFCQSHATSIRMEALAVLRENESLETFSMPSKETMLEDYLAFVTALQPNTTLKSLCLNDEDFYGDDDELKDLILDFYGDEDEFKDLILALRKNYGLEEIPGLHHGAGEIQSIFELTERGVAILCRTDHQSRRVSMY
jgi:hypothetical protein